jgi:(2Fe-2S) ferredoxin
MTTKNPSSKRSKAAKTSQAPTKVVYKTSTRYGRLTRAQVERAVASVISKRS